MPDRVRITEVGPRDGLQNEPGIIPTEQKVRLVELCAATGVDEVEVTSFVSPKWVPQLGDAAEVLRQLYFEGVEKHLYQQPRQDDLPGAAKALSKTLPVLSALVPNERGMQDFFHTISPPATWKLSVFTAASETFSKKNTNASIAESIDRFRPITGKWRLTRGYVSCAIACPFEGPIATEQVARVAEMLAGIGATEIDLGDTIGAGTPETVSVMLRAVRAKLGDSWWKPDRMTLHLHDTFGRAGECVKAALDLGVRSFDGSVAGLGGCPYASTPGKRAPGNISTETLVRTIHAAGYTTGVDLDKLAVAADYARSIVAQARSSA